MQIGESAFNLVVQQGNVITPNEYLPFIPRNLKSVLNKAVHVDPTCRYQSAVEMRRALERLSYPGYWTTDACGNFVGHNERYEFRFEERAKTLKTFEFTALKKNKVSGRETKISTYSAKNNTRKQADNLKRKFMQWVVTG
jgi:hypothetical protein